MKCCFPASVPARAWTSLRMRTSGPRGAHKERVVQRLIAIRGVHGAYHFFNDGREGID